MKTKSFDCVKMKHDIQQQILQELTGLSLEQQRKRSQQLIESDPILARLWRRTRPAAPAPRTDTHPSQPAGA